MNAKSSMLVMMPCYNDWEAVRLLLKRLDANFAANDLRGDVLLVDDCSSVALSARSRAGTFSGIEPG